MRCLVSVMRKEVRHMLRDPWTLAGVTLGAAVLLMLMAYTFSADIEHVPIAAWDADRTPQSRTYLQRFVNDPFFDLTYWAENYQQARRWVESGRARAAIIIPAGFAEAALRPEKVSVQVIIDGTEPNTTHQILGNAEALSASYTVDLLEQRRARVGMAANQVSLPLEFRIKALYNPNLEEINSILPGLMSVVLAMPALAAALSVAREKEQGSLEGLMATPIRRYQLLIGKVIPYLILGLLDIFFFTLLGMAVFGVPFRGSLTDLVLLSTLFLLANFGIGLFVATLVHTQMATLIVAGLIFILPSINESGIFYPLYAMSPESRLEAMLWPATHYVVIARGVFLKGVGVPVLMSSGLYLLAVGLLLNGLTTWRLKKKLR